MSVKMLPGLVSVVVLAILMSTTSIGLFLAALSAVVAGAVMLIFEKYRKGA